ncbi:hypothetical protein RCO48_09245 [Peribacillus frigoritolerans]|nr:hypothetical protein [Peribacillus frigoritolerans]
MWNKENNQELKLQFSLNISMFGLKIILPRSNGKIAYVDLFSGPGKFSDGSVSTPLLILEKCINDDKLRNSVVTVFNDSHPDISQQLKDNIMDLPHLGTLKFKPQVLNTEVGDEIAGIFSAKKTNSYSCFY